MTILKTTLLASGAITCLQLVGTAVPAQAKAESHVQTSDDGKTKTTTTASSAAPNSDANYLDDRLMWDHSIPAWSHDEIMKGGGPGYCLPRNTVAIGQSSSLTTVTRTATSSSGSRSDDTSPPTSDKKYLPVIVDPNKFLWGLFGGMSRAGAQDELDHAKNGEEKADGRKKANGGQKVNSEEKVDDGYVKVGDGSPLQLCEGVSAPNHLVEGQQLYVDPTDALRWGWQYGALVVPFKMQLGGKHAFSGSASVGAFLGYKVPLWDWGIALSPVAFAGASNISVPTSDGGKNSSQTMAGLSYGAGVVGEIKDGFQIGIIFGKDHVDSDNYLYNDKTWISFEIGYSFAQ